MMDIAECVARWGFARLFAECVDKIHFDESRTSHTIDAQASEQLVTRFEFYLRHSSETNGHRNYGLIVHDQNETVAKKHTDLMKQFRREGTLWTNIAGIIETPLFVDSQLTSMVQIADVCSYALRRYLENCETDLFKKVFERADRNRGRGSRRPSLHGQ